LKGALAGWFEDFAKNGPAKRRFVRMAQFHRDEKPLRTSVYHQGPLVAVHGTEVETGPHTISGGANIVTAAYRFARTSGGVIKSFGHTAAQDRLNLEETMNADGLND
jgi:hypothetical protein